MLSIVFQNGSEQLKVFSGSDRKNLIVKDEADETPGCLETVHRALLPRVLVDLLGLGADVVPHNAEIRVPALHYSEKRVWISRR